MDSKTIIIIIIAVIVFIILVKLICSCFNKNTEHFGELEYADETDPYDRPYILQNFLTQDQCRAIINHSESKLIDSEVLGGKHKNVRDSQQHWIPKSDPLAKPLFEKVSKMFNIPFENGEDLQVVRYRPGQFYKEHHDSCCDDNENCSDFIKKGGQRVLTVLIYLNNEFEEGNTYFKNLDLKLKAATGDAIVFYPLAKGTNKCHPYALHSGMPVTSGTKWIANLWFREKKFNP